MNRCFDISDTIAHSRTYLEFKHELQEQNCTAPVAVKYHSAVAVRVGCAKEPTRSHRQRQTTIRFQNFARRLLAFVYRLPYRKLWESHTSSQSSSLICCWIRPCTHRPCFDGAVTTVLLACKLVWQPFFGRT